jgi:hypothetical protein
LKYCTQNNNLAPTSDGKRQARSKQKAKAKNQTNQTQTLTIDDGTIDGQDPANTTPLPLFFHR